MTERDKLLLYIDGNLTSEEAKQLEAQILENQELRAEYYLLRHAQKRIGQRHPEPSPGLWEGIEARIHSESLSDNLIWASKRLAPLMAAAAVILMALVGNTETETEANTVTVADYFDAQTELVLSEIATDSLDIYPPEGE
ncbi:MAG: hypothetical protein QGG64_21020 [Candidatus Latescibacteria bacterium]|nr:hypothetical protein [Candidatus Latescibacterota bacterium]